MLNCLAHFDSEFDFVPWVGILTLKWQCAKPQALQVVFLPKY